VSRDSEILALARSLELAGEFEQARQLYRRVLAEQPSSAELWAQLGRSCHSLGHAEEAAASFEQAVRLRPDFAEAWLDLGKTLRELGRQDAAATCCRQAARLRPHDPDPLNELGTLHLQRCELAQAAACFEQSLQLRPDSVEASNNLGLVLLGQGRLEAAMESFQRAVALRPDLAGVHNNLGLVLLSQCRLREASRHFEEAIRLQPHLADAHNNLGLALDALGMPDEALDAFEQALSVAPDHLGALTNLGNSAKNQGLADQAVACYRRALAVRPEDAAVHSNLILAMQYQPGSGALGIASEAQHFARRHEDSLAIDAARPIQKLPGARLRIGYVSADFREHAVCHFLEPILSTHDRGKFEIFCFADVSQPDATTERLRGLVEHWRWLTGMSEAEAASMIRQEGVDFLVDLHGHTAGNRLLAFARRPAPIQVSYLGFLGTTGLRSIDYYVTDEHADPAGLADAHYRERLVRLPICAFCYWPGPAPDAGPDLAAHRSGCLTFGCLNSPAKLNEEVLHLWTRVLAAVPGSKLMLAAGGSRGTEERFLSTFARLGVSPDRLRFAGRAATRAAYLRVYRDIDIALDPSPYNGVTTTCDALWMGVPVISLAGAASPSRQGVRFLRSVGLDELIAGSPDDYVRIACALAEDLPRLEALHSGLRERMRRSPLMDSKRLSRDLEAAYTAMWQGQFLGDSGFTVP
jgi:predicted O-linked N-acetylglucosamine transferase (SPINDLY family)